MKLRVLMIAVLLVHSFTSNCSSNDDLDMDDLFSNEGFIVDVDELENDSVMSTINGRSVSFSGSLYNKSRYTTKRSDYTLKTIFVDYVDLLPDNIREQNQATIDKIKDTYHIGEDDWFTSTMTANLLFDIRLVDNVRGFMNLDAINIVLAFNEFEIRNKITSRGKISPIEPFLV